MSPEKQPPDPSKSGAFTGRAKKHRTSWKVKFADRISFLVITIGGIGTIAAVLLVFVLLLWVVWPLFNNTTVAESNLIPAPWQNQTPVELAIDEYQVIGWALHANGEVTVYRLDTGEIVDTVAVTDKKITAVATMPLGSESDLPGMSVALGLDSGEVLLGDIKFATSYADQDESSDEIKAMDKGEVATVGKTVVQITPTSQVRAQRVVSEWLDPMAAADAAIISVDRAPGSKGPVVAAVTSEGKAVWGKGRKRGLGIGPAKVTIEFSELNVEDAAPRFVRLFGQGDNTLVVWPDGRARRFDTRLVDEIKLAEVVDLLEDSDAEVHALRFALGRETLLVGDSDGVVKAWSRVRNTDAQTSDGNWLLSPHVYEPGPAGVATIGISQRSRMFLVGYENGACRVFHGTTEQLLVEFQQGQGPIKTGVIAPKDDGVYMAYGDRLALRKMDAAYPEATVGSLMGSVWYEGYPKPDVVWQSSFAGVESEMKLGLRPLVFGTIKATFYSMMFGAPIALLAAIYTSEFIDPRYRGAIKSTIELMASLPSVVLGFLAALVFAPIIKLVIPGTIASFFFVPAVCLLGAFLWQQVPQPVALRWRGLRMPLLVACLFLGVWGALRSAEWIERMLFAGDISLWLDNQQGVGTGGWLLLFIPLCGVLVAAMVILLVNPRLRQVTDGWSRRSFVLVNLAKFLLAIAATMLLAWLVSTSLNAAGFDPRGSYVGTYDQRNALIVGFVMGFAIIPIIYTIAEDALSTVPAHLRSASLGAGATPWQTAVRVVIPTAMSGLFSALMIGLGRAVGETMIVLMAAGNTPVRDWNIFNGFRTLSANIAVELPEAVKDSTHYRTLFLAALTLFFMTFIVNTMAEIVRLRFRKRAVQL